MYIHTKITNLEFITKSVEMFCILYTIPHEDVVGRPIYWYGYGPMYNKIYGEFYVLTRGSNEPTPS